MRLLSEQGRIKIYERGGSENGQSKKNTILVGACVLIAVIASCMLLLAVSVPVVAKMRVAESDKS